MSRIIPYMKYVGFTIIGLCLLSVPVSLLLFYLHNGYMPSLGEENAFLVSDGYSKDIFFSSFMCYSILPLSLIVTLIVILLESLVQKKVMWKSFVVWILFSVLFIVLFTIKIGGMPFVWWLWD